MKFILTFIALLIFWFMLSGHFSTIIVTSAVIYALIAAYFTYNYFIEDISLAGIKRIFKFIAYL
ncbi:hypothetical protein, partial [Flexistipes sinusarabici]|uniref:hypothetical protein n=1 Tax=Flexistipes sinusarabici TaxID=2352 RepID=UPI0026EC9E7C